MIVKELIKKLASMPPEAVVTIDGSQIVTVVLDSRPTLGVFEVRIVTDEEL